MFCTNCGKENSENNKFCFSCGAGFKQQDQITKSINTSPNKIPLNLDFALYNDSIKIKKGDTIYSSRSWVLSNDLLSLRTTSSLTAPSFSIPIEEILTLKKCDNANQFEVTLSDGKELLIEMDNLAFNALHGSFKNNGNKPNGISLPAEVKGGKRATRKKVLAVIALSSIVALLGYGGQLEPSGEGKSNYSGKYKPKYVSEDVQVTSTQADALVNIIRAYGFSCISLSSALQSSYDGSFSVTCNNWKYRYDIEDVGGNWVVTVD